MKNKDIKSENNAHIAAGNTQWAESVWKDSWTYIRTVVDTVREPFLILDKDLRVIAANETFYRTFMVSLKDTENKLLYEIGDGQWDIPSLKKLLENILPKDTFFRGLQVDHEFPNIGRKTMLLNARPVYQDKNGTNSNLEPIIFLAIEDITEFTSIVERLASKTSEHETKMIERTEELESKIAELTSLNKTVSGLSGTVAELRDVIRSLKNDIASLHKNKLND